MLIYSKIYDTTTTVIEKSKYNIKRGLYIDVFPLDGIGDSIKESKKNYSNIKFLLSIIAARTLKIRPERKLYKNISIILLGSIPEKLIDTHSIINRVNKKASSYSFDEKKYVGSLFSAWRFKEVISRDIYGNPTLYKFEMIEVYGVEKPNDYILCVPLSDLVYLW